MLYPDIIKLWLIGLADLEKVSHVTLTNYQEYTTCFVKTKKIMPEKDFILLCYLERVNHFLA